jgi:hypothetical protein
MDASKVQKIREDLERAEARRLQPHFICSFFLEAFKLLGGTFQEREPKRFEITHVPAAIRSRDRAIGCGEPVLNRYERITFEKTLISVPGKPLASFICPGHPLLDATIDLVRERFSSVLRQGAIFIDPTDEREDIRALFYLENSIQDARTDKAGNRRVVSRQMQFVEVSSQGTISPAGYAPYLDYRPATEDEKKLLNPEIDQSWRGKNYESEAISYAISKVVPHHLDEVKSRKEELIQKTRAAVHERLTKEIVYWDNRATDLREREDAGKAQKMNSQRARERADDLQARLQRRMLELELEGKLSALPPVVIGGALIVPQGLLNRLTGESQSSPGLFARDTEEVERKAMNAVFAEERRLGFEPRDVSAAKIGYDIESKNHETGHLRFIEVKGRVAGAKTVTITKNEILTALNKPEYFILALVEVDGDKTKVSYLTQLKFKEPGFAVTSVNFNLGELLSSATPTSGGC